MMSPKPVKTAFFTANIENAHFNKFDSIERYASVLQQFIFFLQRNRANARSSHPIPPAPTINTFTDVMREDNSSPKSLCTCDERDFTRVEAIVVQRRGMIVVVVAGEERAYEIALVCFNLAPVM